MTCTCTVDVVTQGDLGSGKINHDPRCPVHGVSIHIREWDDLDLETQTALIRMVGRALDVFHIDKKKEKEK